MAGDFGPGGAPTYNDFDRNGVTWPNGPAIGTVPRSPTPGRASGPYGVPERPVATKRNGPIVATVVISAVLLLGLGCFLTLSMTGALKGLTGVFGSGPTPTATIAQIKVPSVVGMTDTNAIGLATRRLPVQGGPEREHDDEGAGHQPGPRRRSTRATWADRHDHRQQ